MKGRGVGDEEEEEGEEGRDGNLRRYVSTHDSTSAEITEKQGEAGGLKLQLRHRENIQGDERKRYAFGFTPIHKHQTSTIHTRACRTWECSWAQACKGIMSRLLHLTSFYRSTHCLQVLHRISSQYRLFWGEHAWTVVELMIINYGKSDQLRKY